MIKLSTNWSYTASGMLKPKIRVSQVQESKVDKTVVSCMQESFFAMLLKRKEKDVNR